MKIGVISWGFPPIAGGVEMHLVMICPEMIKLGAEVVVLTAAVKNEPEREKLAGVPVRRSEMLSVSHLESLKKEKKDIYGMARKLFEEFINEEKIEIIQAHNLLMDYYDLSRALTDVCKEKKIPCYLIIHNDKFIDRDNSVVLRILSELPWDKLVSISKYVEGSLRSMASNVSEDKWMTILHGIDLDMFVPFTEKEKEKFKGKYGFAKRRVILHPARIMPWKGIIPAVKALPEIIAEFPDVLMVLTGRTDVIFKEPEEIRKYNEELDRTIKELGVEKNVHIGDYDYEDIPKLTALSDVAIYTTIGDEPFGLCPVEAMACKVPQIVTSSGGLVESVQDSVTGFIISKEEEKIPKQLAECVLRIFRSKELARKMGGAGRAHAEKVFSKTRMARDFIVLSEELLKSKGAENDNRGRSSTTG